MKKKKKGKTYVIKKEKKRKNFVFSNLDPDFLFVWLYQKFVPSINQVRILSFFFYFGEKIDEFKTTLKIKVSQDLMSVCVLFFLNWSNFLDDNRYLPYIFFIIRFDNDDIWFKLNGFSLYIWILCVCVCVFVRVYCMSRKKDFCSIYTNPDDKQNRKQMYNETNRPNFFSWLYLYIYMVFKCHHLQRQ